MPHRELEQKQPDVSAQPSWESSPWQPEERVAAQPEGQDESPLQLSEQSGFVVELPPLP
jgi:hypothetical protein